MVTTLKSLKCPKAVKTAACLSAASPSQEPLREGQPLGLFFISSLVLNLVAKINTTPDSWIHISPCFCGGGDGSVCVGGRGLSPPADTH